MRAGAHYEQPMALSFFQNTFAGNPLNRASERRGDTEWLAEQLQSPDSLGLALWNGKPLIEKTKDGGAQIAYLPAKLVGELAGGPERLLFMGLWKDTAIFALDMEGTADPAQGPPRADHQTRQRQQQPLHPRLRSISALEERVFSSPQIAISMPSSRSMSRSGTVSTL